MPGVVLYVYPLTPQFFAMYRVLWHDHGPTTTPCYDMDRVALLVRLPMPELYSYNIILCFIYIL